MSVKYAWIGISKYRVGTYSEGRKRRIELLLASNEAEFLAITGRRRVGKTYLIDRLLGEYFCFTMVGIQHGSMEQQLDIFGVYGEV